MNLTTEPADANGHGPTCAQTVATFPLPASMGDHGYLFVYGAWDAPKGLVVGI